MDNNIREKTVSSLIWKMSEKFGQQAIQLVISVILARILNPEIYGEVALVNVFVTIALVLVDYGFGNALIRGTTEKEAECNTIFISSILEGLLLSALIILISPMVSSFYGDDNLKVYLIVLSLSVFVGAFGIVPNALLARDLEYRKIFICNIITSLFSGLIGIALALYGYGVWALIIHYISQRLISSLALFIASKYQPHLQFSLSCFDEAFKFSWKVAASAFLTTLFTNIRSLLIGRFYTKSDLAYYEKGQQFPGIINVSTDFSFQNVMYSVYSKSQDDYTSIKNMMRKSLITSSYILCPCMFGMCAVAEPFIGVVLGEQWLSVVPIMQILCIAGSINTPVSVSSQAINAIGRSNESLKAEIVVRTAAIVLIVITIRMGIYAVAVSQIIVNILNLFIRGMLSEKYFKYSSREQIIDLLPNYITSLVMGSLVFGFYSFFLKGLSYIGSLFILITLGVIVFVLLSKVFKLKGFANLVDISAPFIAKAKRLFVN